MRAHVEANEDPDTRFLSRCDSYFVPLFSNHGLDVHHLFASWVPFFVAERTEVVLALDWTDYDADDQSTLVLSVVTSHGRSTPLLWKTVRKSQLKKRRNAIEEALLLRLRQVIPESVRMTIGLLCRHGHLARGAQRPPPRPLRPPPLPTTLLLSGLCHCLIPAASSHR